MPLARHAAMAAISHPQFKLRWVPNTQRESLRATFVQCLNEESSTVTGEVAVSTASVDEDDYGYNETASDVTQCGVVETEASAYLTDPERTLSMLHKYPLVKSASFASTQRSLLQLRLNGCSALADRLKQPDRTGCRTPTLKNFFCLKLIQVKFETWTKVYAVY